jgi:hypothetical protein
LNGALFTNAVLTGTNFGAIIENAIAELHLVDIKSPLQEPVMKDSIHREMILKRVCRVLHK